MDLKNIRLRKAIRYSLIALAAFLLYVAWCITDATLHDYNPEAVLPLQTDRPAKDTLVSDSVLSVLTWNIGYAGLGAESDFFYDNGGFCFSWGGMVHSPASLVQKNLDGILTLAASTRADFFLFQEIDQDADRSHHHNEYAALGERLDSLESTYAPNLIVKRIPLPLCEPWHVYGKVNSGIATFSRYRSVQSTRHQLPGKFGWPKHLFQLDRCASLHRYPTRYGKDLVVINVHLSAHDHDGALKYQELDKIRQLAQAEYGKGNYVIIGGDWNMCPPFFRFDSFMPGKTQGYTQLNLDPAAIGEDWQCLYDPYLPTNRKAKLPYQPGTTFVTIIDYFLLSPNLRANKIRVIQHDFQFSDHQPVWLEFRLLPPS